MAFGKGKPVEWRSSNFKVAFIATAVSLVVYLIAFCSPYWLQTYHTVPWDFKNMGLWEACFNKYYLRENPYIIEFDGCYWTFDIFFDFRRLPIFPGNLNNSFSIHFNKYVTYGNRR